MGYDGKGHGTAPSAAVGTNLSYMGALYEKSVLSAVRRAKCNLARGMQPRQQRYHGVLTACGRG